MNIIREVDDSICDNKLVPYWTGINIIGVNTDKPAVNYKVYYQLRCPLFLNDAFDKESICKLNSILLSKMGKILSVDISRLLGNDEFVFCNVATKPVASYRERTAFAIRISNHNYKSAFVDIRDFLVQQLNTSSSIIEKIYGVAYRIFKDNHFKTFPIGLIGINKYEKNDIPYAQIYITNNPDTTLGNINQISKKSALQNTLSIINALSLNIDLRELSELVEFAYSKNAFLSINGIDIYMDKIKKFKLYFRFNNIINVSKALNIFSEKISILDKMPIQYTDDIIDFIAFTFVPKGEEFIFDGIQIYQR